MDYKQLKIMALALSFPGLIFILGFFYKFLVDKQYMSNEAAITLLGLILLSYIMVIIKTLFKKR